MKKRDKEIQKLLDYMYDLFPVPKHEEFDLLPHSEQMRGIGQGEVMAELDKYCEENL